MSNSLRVFSYNRCSTCRKALSWLESNGFEHCVIDITQTPPTRSELATAAAYFGDRKPLFNTSGKSYRELGSAVVKAMSDDEALDALAKDGRLIKRPFLLLPDGSALVGFKPEIWEERLRS